jgi:hypothetical protein
MRVLPLLLAATLPLPALVAAEPSPTKSLPLPGDVFQLAGRTAFLIPAKFVAPPSKPWVWYAPTLPGLPSDAERWMFERFTDAGISIAGSWAAAAAD